MSIEILPTLGRPHYLFLSSEEIAQKLQKLSDSLYESCEDLLTTIGKLETERPPLRLITTENLSAMNCWEGMQGNFRLALDSVMDFFMGASKELHSISSELGQGVSDHHARRIEEIAGMSDDFNRRLIQGWNDATETGKVRDKPEFHLIEALYREAREMIGLLRDETSLLAERLRRLVGTRHSKESHAEILSQTGQSNSKIVNGVEIDFGKRSVTYKGIHKIFRLGGLPWSMIRSCAEQRGEISIDPFIKKKTVDVLHREIWRMNKPWKNTKERPFHLQLGSFCIDPKLSLQ